MSGIDNTTSRMKDPAEMMLFLGEAMAGGPDAPIKRQERDGQRQLVSSEMLPTDHGDDAPWLALGFTFGEPDKNDPLFQPAALPEGWQKRATDHSMGSVIIDEHGRKRVSIFYKAAFYDRSANMHLIGLHWYVQEAVEYDGPAIIFDDRWATREAVADEMRKLQAEHLERAAEFAGYASDVTGRDIDNRTRCAEQAAKSEAKAILYDAPLAEVTTGGAA